MLRVAVGVRTAAEAPALHDALEAASLRRPRDLDLIARREDPDVDDVADLVRRDLRLLPRRIVEADAADHLRRGRQAGLRGVTDSGLVRATAELRALPGAIIATKALL